jgi:AraC-like DNA-binding protein
MGLLKVQLPVSNEVGADPSTIDVAVAVEFDSVSAFNQAFRAVVGDSPKQYRRRIETRRVGRYETTRR